MMENKDVTFASRGQLFARVRRRILCYAPFLWGMVLLQTTVFGEFSPFGMTPDLALLSVFGIALFDDEYAGCVSAVFAGFLEGALGGGIRLWTVAFLAIAVFCGTVLRHAMGRPIVSYLIYGAMICLFRMVLTLAVLCVTTGLSGFDLRDIFRLTLIPELCCHLCLLLPLYFPLRGLVSLASGQA